MINYPCKECIVKGVCSDLCDKVLNSNYLLEFILKYKCCPDCGEEKLIGCGGDTLDNSSQLVDSCATCIDCGSLYFNVSTSRGKMLLRNRKFKKNVVKDVNDNKVMTFWYYLKSCGLITYKEYYQ
jgi:hypothetical protein